MLTRIELTNFMSHVATVIEPAAGLTVLVGPNNCGKSAIVAALQLLCKNQEAKFAIRHGARECLVQVQTREGDTIVWRRTKTSASYRLNDQLFDRLGRGVPDSLHALLKLPLVGDDADADFDIHFGAQKSPIFLLNSSPATAARFFASSSDAIRLVEMQRRHKDKVVDKQKHKSRLEAESKQLTAELERLAPAVEIDRRLKAANEDYCDLVRQTEHIEQTKRDAAALAVQSQLVFVRQAEHDALHPLSPPPEFDDPTPLKSLHARLKDAHGEREQAAARSQACAALTGPPTLFDVPVLASSCQRIEQLFHEVQRAEAAQAATRPLAAPPTLAEVEAIERWIGQLIAADYESSVATSRCRTLRRLESSPPALADEASLTTVIEKLTLATTLVRREQQRLAVAAALAPLPAVAEAQPLSECVAKLAAAEQLVVVAQQQAHEAEQQIATAREELFDYASSATCPTCGSPVDALRLMARAAVGLGGHSHD